MPYNAEIDARIMNVIGDWNGIERKKMFGGTCHLLHGNMLCGVYKDYLILRLGEEKFKSALKSQFAKPFDITGRPMKGWVMVEQNGFAKEEDLMDWLNRAKEFVSTLPPK
jgi:TfoX/Sxy family transcriptional regulator of competence genes